MKTEYMPIFFLALGIVLLTFPDLFAYVVSLGLITWGIKGIIGARKDEKERRDGYEP